LKFFKKDPVANYKLLYFSCVIPRHSCWGWCFSTKVCDAVYYL